VCGCVGVGVLGWGGLRVWWCWGCGGVGDVVVLSAGGLGSWSVEVL
jgi:hypothetical protein